jgi:hypothetical protein
MVTCKFEAGFSQPNVEHFPLFEVESKMKRNVSVLQKDQQQNLPAMREKEKTQCWSELFLFKNACG